MSYDLEILLEIWSMIYDYDLAGASRSYELVLWAMSY